jgi:transcriptional regulator with XRE-family HTH domain/tetratricopeptide (TPR) repeat protein
MGAIQKDTSLDSFGGYLRFLRRRARLTQTELSIAVGYSPGQISMLESGQRQPNVSAVMALFVAALGLQNDTQAARRLIELANAAAATAPSIRVSNQIEWRQEEIGALEEIPPLPTCYIERAEAGERIAHWLKRERWAAICGLPGMGKSTLAAAIAHTYAPTHPTLWIAFGHGLNQTPEDLLRQLALFALAYGSVAYGSPATQSSLLRRIAGGETTGPLRQQLFHVGAAINTLRSPLLVFDDAHLVNNNRGEKGAAGLSEMAEVLQSVRDHAPYARLLYATREELDLPGLPHLMLQGMERGEAFELMAAMGLQRGRDAAVEGSEFDPILARTAGNPLLLRLAVGQLEQGRQAPPAVVGQNSAYAPVNQFANQVVNQVVEQLPVSARLLLDWLVVWRNVIDLTDPALAEWLATHFGQVELFQSTERYDHSRAVDLLRRKRIVDLDTHAYLHPLLREPLAIALHADPPRRHEMHRLAAGWAEEQGDRIQAAHHCCTAGDLVRACNLLEESDETGASPVRTKAQTHAATAVIDEVLVQLQRLQRHNNVQSESTESSTPRETAREMRARLLALRGDLLINTLRAAEARDNYRSSIDLTAAPVTRAQLAQRLALSLLRIGHSQDALNLCEDALRTLEGNSSAETTNLRLQLSGVLVRAYIAEGRLDDAATLCHEAIAAARLLRLSKPTLAEKVLTNAHLGLGYVLRRRADNAQARIHFERAVVHARAGGAHGEEAEALSHLCVTLRELGDFVRSEQSGLAALEIAQSAGNDFLVANILHRLSITSYYHNELMVALERSEQAAALQRQMGDAGGMVLCDSLQALVLTSIGELEEAEHIINRARQESNLLDNNWLQGLVLYVYGIVNTLNGKLAAAEDALRAALGQADYVKDVSMREGVLLFLGINEVAQGHLEEAARIEVELAGNVAVEVELLGGLFRGMAAIGRGESDQACAIAQNVRRRAQSSGYLIYAYEADQLLAAAEDPPPLDQLPSFVCLHRATHR